MVHKSSTLKHTSSRIIISYVSITNNKLWSQDINKEYFQSDESLRRPVFVIPPQQLNLPKDVIWKLLKQLYGLSELQATGTIILKDIWYTTWSC